MYRYKYKAIHIWICQEVISGFYCVLSNKLYSAYLISYEFHGMIILEKLNVAVNIITMLESFRKKLAHIEKISNSYIC